MAGGLLFVASNVQAGVSVGAGVEYFYWREYTSGTNEEFLHETGPRTVVTLELSAGVAHSMDLIVRGKVYGGDVDYYGAVQNLYTGQRMPFNSKTGYNGITAEGGFSFKSPHDFDDRTDELLRNHRSRGAGKGKVALPRGLEPRFSP